ncbi:MAG: hypothetical protein KIT58_07720, partial [Planctomycetota bacterium]|nr:hypothetical protein [Planctomycetota bacterium]
PVLPRDFVPVPDRWRVQFPDWERFDGAGETDAPYSKGSILDPYHQNVLKGDYPILGDDTFLVMTFQSDTLVEGRSFPIAAGVSTARPRSEQFFGKFDQLLVNQNIVLSAELFKGDTAFKPKDLAVKITPVINVNQLWAQENNLVNIDVREGKDRTDWHVGIQEALIDYHLLDLGPNYDFLTLIGGVQGFQSDFRGFLYSDNNLGVRLQGNYLANRLQWNLAWFHQLDKDTNSGLNDYRFRQQNVVIANFYCQDFLSELSQLFKGYTLLLSYHGNFDDSPERYDDNGFLIRPARIGRAVDERGRTASKDVRAHYLGWGGEGHIGRLNLSHMYYFVVGEESFNEIAGKKQDIQAHFVALEASTDVDWVRLKGSFMWASGDRNPDNGTAGGFDSILGNPFFAGAGFSYFNRQNIPLAQTAVQLVNRLDLLPSLRSSKSQGTANFVNPGLWLWGLGASAKLTPKLFVDFNANLLQFDRTEVLERVLVQRRISRTIGVDLSVGVQWRPLLTDNVIFTAGAGCLLPGAGLKQLYQNETLYSGFLAMTLTW